MRSQAIEDYLKTIYKIRQEEGTVGTSSLAERLGVAPASATGMIKKLASQGLVRHEPYHGVALTAMGEEIALEVIRHHRLVELYLATIMGLPWDRVHAEAEKWEHVISEEIEERMDNLLGHPEFDPHGAPIPTRGGTLASEGYSRLVDLEEGQSATLKEVNDRDPEVLRCAARLGLHPGVAVSVIAKDSAEGTIHLRVGAVDRLLAFAAAREMLVAGVTSDGSDVK